MQVYFAEVLAYLPYRIPEDPLSVVYHINKLLAMRGDALLAQLKVQSTTQRKSGRISDL